MYLEMQSQLNTKETVSIHFISYLVRGDDGEFLQLPFAKFCYHRLIFFQYKLVFGQFEVANGDYH